VFQERKIVKKEEEFEADLSSLSLQVTREERVTLPSGAELVIVESEGEVDLQPANAQDTSPAVEQEDDEA